MIEVPIKSGGRWVYFDSKLLWFFDTAKWHIYVISTPDQIAPEDKPTHKNNISLFTQTFQEQFT